MQQKSDAKVKGGIIFFSLKVLLLLLTLGSCQLLHLRPRHLLMSPLPACIQLSCFSLQKQMGHLAEQYLFPCRMYMVLTVTQKAHQWKTLVTSPSLD